MDYKIKFIIEEDYKSVVKKVIETYHKSYLDKSFDNMTKNIIDPVKMYFDTIVYGQSVQNFIESERIRQIDKTNNNAIGYFHQNLLSKLKGAESEVEQFSRKWDIVFTNEQGIVLNDKNVNKLYIELKNKFNTMNNDSKTKIKRDMDEVANDNQLAILCIVLDKKSSFKQLTEYTYEMSIDKLYYLLTGEEDAFKQIIDVLPYIIDEVMQENGISPLSDYNDGSEEFGGINEDVIKKQAFETYLGFSEEKE